MNLKSYRNKQIGDFMSTKHYLDFLTAIYASKYHNKIKPDKDHCNDTINKWKHKLSKRGIEHLNNNLDQIQRTLKMNINIYKPYSSNKTNLFGENNYEYVSSYPTYDLLVNSDNMFKPIITEK